MFIVLGFGVQVVGAPFVKPAEGNQRLGVRRHGRHHEIALLFEILVFNVFRQVGKLEDLLVPVLEGVAFGIFFQPSLSASGYKSRSPAWTRAQCFAGNGEVILIAVRGATSSAAQKIGM
jgi:hypothetical protein